MSQPPQHVPAPQQLGNHRPVLPADPWVQVCRVRHLAVAWSKQCPGSSGPRRCFWVSRKSRAPPWQGLREPSSSPPLCPDLGVHFDLGPCRGLLLLAGDRVLAWKLLSGQLGRASSLLPCQPGTQCLTPTVPTEKLNLAHAFTGCRPSWGGAWRRKGPTSQSAGRRAGQRASSEAPT